MWNAIIIRWSLNIIAYLIYYIKGKDMFIEDENCE